MTFTKLPKSITAEELLSTPLPPVKWIIPRSTPSRIGAVCRSQQGGKELADLVAVFADRAG